MNEAKANLIHGNSDYLVFKELKELKTDLASKNINLVYFDGSKSLSFLEIRNALESSDLFGSSSAVIIRNLSDSRSFFPFVEQLSEYLNKSKNLENQLFIFNFGKVLKTSKICKAISKIGNVKELTTPKAEEIIDVIKKSISIENDAARLLVEFANSDLFQIRNETKKLQNHLFAKKKERIEIDDVKLLCVKNLNQNEIWGIGGLFLKSTFEPENHILKSSLLKELDDLLLNNVAVMQILFSFYQYILNSIKLKQMVDQGKNFRECLGLGYFFVKEFFEKRNLMNVDKLMQINSQLLDYEFAVKTGNIDEVIGIRQVVLET